MIRYALAQDTIGRGDIEPLIRWLRIHPHLTQGPRVRAFEQKWSRWLGFEAGPPPVLEHWGCEARREATDSGGGGTFYASRLRSRGFR